jgi:hypothetical protein
LVSIAALLVLTTLMFSKKLVWNEKPGKWVESNEALDKMMRIHEPTILKMGDKELLHIPTSHFTDNSINISHEFYMLENGKLQRLEFVQQ